MKALRIFAAEPELQELALVGQAELHITFPKETLKSPVTSP